MYSELQLDLLVEAYNGEAIILVFRVISLVVNLSIMIDFKKLTGAFRD